MSISGVILMAVCTVIMAVQFKSSKQEYGIYMTIAAAVIIALYSISKIRVILDVINEICQYANVGEYLSVMIKIIGITYVTEFVSDLCKDTGYSAVGGQILIFGKVSVLAVSVPVFKALVNVINEMLT